MTMTKQEALQKIEELKQYVEILDKKSTKEQRFLEIINGLEIKIDKEKYPNSIFFFKNGEYYLEIEKSNLWVRNEYIWQIFETEFSMEYDDIQKFMQDMVEEHFKIKGVTAPEEDETIDKSVEEHFKIKGVTAHLSFNIVML